MNSYFLKNIKSSAAKFYNKTRFIIIITVLQVLEFGHTRLRLYKSTKPRTILFVATV